MSPTAVDDLRDRTRAFIREVVLPAEPKPGAPLDDATRDALRAQAREAGVFAPHAPVEYGGGGIPIDQWSPIFQEAGYSPIGPAVRRKLDKIESDRYEASFRLALMRKDMGLVTDAAARRDVTAPVVGAAAAWMERAEADGLGDLDYSAVVAEIRGRDATG